MIATEARAMCMYLGSIGENGRQLIWVATTEKLYFQGNFGKK